MLASTPPSHHLNPNFFTSSWLTLKLGLCAQLCLSQKLLFVLWVGMCPRLGRCPFCSSFLTASGSVRPSDEGGDHNFPEAQPSLAMMCFARSMGQGTLQDEW